MELTKKEHNQFCKLCHKICKAHSANYDEVPCNCDAIDSHCPAKLIETWFSEPAK